MKKKMLLLIIISLFFICEVMAQEPAETLFVTETGYATWFAPGCGPLWNQMDSPSGDGAIICTDFVSTMFDPYDIWGADDFEVPAGETWDIESMTVLGAFIESSGPGTGLGNLKIYEDAAGMPGATLYDLPGCSVVDDGIGNLDITLTSSATLSGGIYWISWQYTVEFAVGGQWGWEVHMDSYGSEFYWINPGGGVGIGTDWFPCSTLFPTYIGHDLCFALYGSGSVGETIFAKNNINPFRNKSVERSTVKNPDTSLISRVPTISTSFNGRHSINSRDLLGYNVYIDGAFVAFTTDIFYQYFGLVDGQTYMAGVTALYDEGESAIIEFEFTYIPVLDPPQNLGVACIEDYAHFTWEAPVVDTGERKRSTKANKENTRDLTGYNVYLDQEEVATNIPDLEYDFYDLINGNYYDAGVKAIYDEGTSEIIEINFQYTGTGIGNILPLITELNGNYPNPFNPTTIINYSLAEEGNIELIVFNIKGQKVKTLINEIMTAGNHQIIWDGKDENSKAVSSGIYFYKMNTNNYTSTKKMILLK